VRGGVARTIKHNVIDSPWIGAAFARGGSTLRAEALSIFAGEGAAHKETEACRFCFPCWLLVWFRLSERPEALA
jgi:hypothetical protein